MKGIKDLNKKDIRFMFWKSQHSKVLILLKLIYKFSAISVKVSARLFVDIHKRYKIYTKRQRS